MNTYRGSTIGAPSKATAATLCQKCLKRGHYSYECKAVAQERPYVSRPSRTQQLFNPKLVPKLTNNIPQDIFGSKGKADQQLPVKQLEGDRGRKRERDSNDPERPTEIKRLRSTSSRSSVSASTISTNPSQSPRRGKGRNPDHRSRRRSSATFQENGAVPLQNQKERPSRIYQSRSDSDHPIGRGRRSRRSWSRGSYSSVSRSRSPSPKRDQLKDTSRRNTERVRSRSRTPPNQQRAYSRKPDDGRDEFTRDRGRAEHFDTANRRDLGQTQDMNGRNETRSYRKNRTVPPPRVPSRSPRRTRAERSLSPFSQRVALTKAMNAGK